MQVFVERVHRLRFNEMDFVLEVPQSRHAKVWRTLLRYTAPQILQILGPYTQIPSTRHFGLVSSSRCEIIIDHVMARAFCCRLPSISPSTWG